MLKLSCFPKSVYRQLFSLGQLVTAFSSSTSIVARRFPVSTMNCTNSRRGGYSDPGLLLGGAETQKWTAARKQLPQIRPQSASHQLDGCACQNEPCHRRVLCRGRSTPPAASESHALEGATGPMPQSGGLRITSDTSGLRCARLPSKNGDGCTISTLRTGCRSGNHRRRTHQPDPARDYATRISR